MYEYYSIRTETLSLCWKTREIEQYLENTGLFDRKEAGAYQGNCGFLSLQLLLVSDYDSWSSKDYDDEVTNDIEIVSADNKNLQLLRELASGLGGNLTEDG